MWQETILINSVSGCKQCFRLLWGKHKIHSRGFEKRPRQRHTGDGTSSWLVVLVLCQIIVCLDRFIVLGAWVDRRRLLRHTWCVLNLCHSPTRSSIYEDATLQLLPTAVRFLQRNYLFVVPSHHRCAGFIHQLMELEKTLGVDCPRQPSFQVNMVIDV